MRSQVVLYQVVARRPPLPGAAHREGGHGWLPVGAARGKKKPNGRMDEGDDAGRCTLIRAALCSTARQLRALSGTEAQGPSRRPRLVTSPMSVSGRGRERRWRCVWPGPARPGPTSIDSHTAVAEAFIREGQRRGARASHPDVMVRPGPAMSADDVAARSCFHVDPGPLSGPRCSVSGWGAGPWLAPRWRQG